MIQGATFHSSSLWQLFDLHLLHDLEAISDSDVTCWVVGNLLQEIL